MKFSDIALDVDGILNGRWVDKIPGLGDVKIKTRGLGNADYEKMQRKRLEGMSASERDSLTPERSDEITNELIVETLILGWSNVQDDSGKEMAFSKEVAAKWLADPKMRVFRNACIYAAGVVADMRASSIKADAGNSKPA